MDRRRSSTIIPDIYTATINPEHWEMVMESVAELTNSKAACLYYQDRDCGVANTIAQFGCTTEMFPDFNREFAILDSIFDKAAYRNGKNIDIPTSEEGIYKSFYLDDDSFCKDADPEFYKNCLKPSGIYYMGRVIFLDSYQQKAAISFLREEKMGPWKEGDIRVIHEIIPHFMRALNMHAEFTRLRVHQEALIKGLDRLVIGLLLYDRDGQPVYVNPTAKAIIKAHPALDLKDGGLVLRNTDENRKLCETIQNTAMIDLEDSWMQSVSIAVTHPEVEAPLPLLVTPMRAAPWGFPMLAPPLPPAPTLLIFRLRAISSKWVA